MKLGGENLYTINAAFGCLYCMGAIDAQGGPIPANIEALFPVWNDVSTWNLAALSPIVRRYTFGTGDFQQSAARVQHGGVGAGRLADHLAADAEPRPAVRRRDERVGERGHPAADDHRAASERHQQLPAARSALRTR